MNHIKLLFIWLAISACQLAYGQAYKAEIMAFQHELNQEFLNPQESPLTKKEIKIFDGHPFFPVDSTYRVEAYFERELNPSPFQMKTSTSRMPTYEKYGRATFELNGIQHTLTIYQSHQLRSTDEYKDYLFLPFTDLTNGKETYGGGRYIDLRIPDGDMIIIDFNKAYNPSCAYNHNYSCPIPPRENDLPVRIEAGVKVLDLTAH